MAKMNVWKRLFPVRTHEGAVAQKVDAKSELRRTVLTCLLWEDTFYDKGNDIAKRIAALAAANKPEVVAALAREARDKMQLRHAPLFLVRELARRKCAGTLLAETLEHVIQRADELGEFVALYWKERKQPLSAGVKRGLAKAFTKFDAYQLAKYDRESVVKLRDVLFLCHAKPKDEAQAALWKKLVENTLESPDTWEVALSAGKDRRENFERLLREGKLGGLAVLRNLRLMLASGVDPKLIREWLDKGVARALPFRFIAAAKHAPKLEDPIERAMLKGLRQNVALRGRTLLVVDVSGSMQAKLSSKSELSRTDAACGVAILAREVCGEVAIYATAGNDHTRKHATAEVPARRGFPLRDAIKAQEKALGGGGIFLVQCMDFIKEHEAGQFDRVIVFTDEQDCDMKLKPASAKKLGRYNYVVNVAPYQYGISYGN